MPTLNAKGFDEEDWEMLLEENPRRAFRIRNDQLQ
jgi:phosphotriesterase-related protein